MKRFLSVIIMLSICLTYLYGCSNSNTPLAVGKKIDKNLTNLYNAVSNLDTIDNSYIANPDIYQLEDISNVNNENNIISKTIALPNQDEAIRLDLDKNYATDYNQINETTTNTLNNTNMSDNVEENKIEILFEEDIDSSDNLSDVLIIDENGDGTILDTEGEIIENIDNIPDETLDQIYTDTIEDEKMTSEEKNKVYQFLFENIRYSPRYATNYNNTNAQTSLNNYIYKVQELYTMTADVVEANNVLSAEKDNLLSDINNIKTYNTKMIDGVFTPNTQQLVALNNYAQDIKTTIKRIKDSNGQLNNEVNNISTSSASYGLSKGVDIINSNYLKILNHIDARITYFKSAMATLDQIGYIFKEAELNITYENIDLDNETSDKEIVTKTTTPNIDTYNNTNTTDNIDTNIQNLSESKNYKNIDTFNNNLKNENINDINMVDDNFPNDNVNNNYIDESNTMSDDRVISNNSNTQNQCLPNYTHDINTPNGVFQNGIITQNNLNNGVANGANGVYSGLAGSNGNTDYFKQNNFNRTEKNVNTYGNNTLIDMINNGTVNNGINTLDLKETNNKPVMVDSTNVENNTIVDNLNNDINQLLDNSAEDDSSYIDIDDDNTNNSTTSDEDIIGKVTDDTTPTHDELPVDDNSSDNCDTCKIDIDDVSLIENVNIYEQEDSAIKSNTADMKNDSNDDIINSEIKEEN